MADSPRRDSPPQVDRVAASRAAVAARRARAAVKSDIADGRRSALDVLAAAQDEPTGTEGGLRVTEFLLSLPAIGPTKMRRALGDLAISASKRLGGLGRHQVVRLRHFVSEREARRGRGRLLVVAGPAAVGKGTVVAELRRIRPRVLVSVSATTRPARPGEVDGRDYYFVDQERFDRMIADGEFLEWALVHESARYGTPRTPIEAALSRGHDVILEIDLQGARSVRAAMPEAVLVFLAPPSWEELVRRLAGRGTESPEEQQRRLATAQREMEASDEFDHVVVNSDVGAAAREIVDLMQ